MVEQPVGDLPVAELGRLGRFGPFFGFSAVAVADRAWLPMSAVTTDPQLLLRRIAAVRVGLAGSAQLEGPDQVEFRVATSITQLGLSARLISVALAARVDGVRMPQIERLVFQDRLGGPYPLGALSAAAADEEQPWVDAMLASVRPIAVAAIGLGLSSKIAWGNVGSGVAGATAMIAAAEPSAGERARTFAAEALSSDELSGTGRYQGDNFRRLSCCLIYRLTDEPMYCADCVLARA